jgi:hypothetical protein
MQPNEFRSLVQRFQEVTDRHEEAKDPFEKAVSARLLKADHI